MEGHQSLRYTKERRRSRVRKIKDFVTTVVFIWMVLSMAVMGYLVYKVNLLEQRLNERAETKVSDTVLPKEDKSEPESVEESNVAQIGDVLKVYLTFDDGPSECTSEILDILDDYGVKATFFVQGKDDEASLALMKRIVDEGHTIGMHSYSHSYNNIYQSLENFTQDEQKIENLIYDATGVDTRFYRFPGGSSNKISGKNMSEFIEYLNESGIIYYDWNVASGDASYPLLTPDTIVENVMKNVVEYKTSIVLLHDSDDKTTTVEALPKLIERLRENEALLLPIDEETTLVQHVTARE